MRQQTKWDGGVTISCIDDPALARWVKSNEMGASEVKKSEVGDPSQREGNSNSLAVRAYVCTCSRGVGGVITIVNKGNNDMAVWHSNNALLGKQN